MKNLIRTVAIFSVIVIIAGGAYSYGVTRASATIQPVNGNPHAFFQPHKNELKASTTGSTAASLPDFTELVAKATPAVVSIRITEAMNTSNQNLPPWMDKNNPLFDFIRPFMQPGNGSQSPVIQGQGSGFILTPDGYILTNAHVVDNATDITVKLQDEREFPAKVTGKDKMSDVAILKIDAKELPTLNIGDSNNLKVGEWVVAIGSPFGFEHTVSAGVVSGITRNLNEGSTVPFIQTDVAINPGSSGGPLLDMNGDVVGMNSQIYSQNGGYMGLSFAIPINLVMNVEDQLVHYGKVTRGRIGVYVQSVNQSLAEAFKLDKPAGALVSQVQPDSPAAKGGLTPGDIILSVDNQPINDSAELARVVSGHKPGDTLHLELVRGGKHINKTVVVTKLSEEQLADNGNPDTTDSGRLGVVVQDLDANMKKQIDEDHGVVVAQVSGAAARAGVKKGDIILSVNSNPVSSVEDLQNLIKDSPKHIALLIKRDQNEIFVPVTIG